MVEYNWEAVTFIGTITIQIYLRALYVLKRFLALWTHIGSCNSYLVWQILLENCTQKRLNSMKIIKLLTSIGIGYTVHILRGFWIDVSSIKAEPRQTHCWHDWIDSTEKKNNENIHGKCTNFRWPAMEEAGRNANFRISIKLTTLRLCINYQMPFNCRTFWINRLKTLLFYFPECFSIIISGAK